MVSKWEVLEVVKDYGPISLVKLKGIIESRTNTTGVGRTASVLCKMGLLERVRKHEDLPFGPVGPVHVWYSKMEKPRQGKLVWLRLTEKAEDLLKKYNVKSFLDLPFAKWRERKMLGRSKRARGFFEKTRAY